MRILVIPIFFLMAAAFLGANELSERTLDEEELEDGSIGNRWRLTVEPQDGQLVVTTFLVDVGDDLKGGSQPASRKVERVHYVPKGLYVQDVGYRKFLNGERKDKSSPFFKKWIFSGLGENIDLGPMFHLGDGGSSVSVKNGCQRVNRRMRLTDGLDVVLEGDKYAKPSRHIKFEFVIETTYLKDAVAKANRVGIKLPELGEEPWSITLPQKEPAVGQDGADKPAAASGAKPKGKEKPEAESEGSSR